MPPREQPAGEGRTPVTEPAVATQGATDGGQGSDSHRGDGAPRATGTPPTPAPEEAAAAGQSCIMIGPASSGKTTLLTAIKRACDLPSEDGLELEFIAERATAKKIKSAIDYITNRREGHPATEDVGHYPFEVRVHQKAPNFWTPPLEADLHLTLSDGGGGFLLPTDDTQDAVRQRFRGELVEAGRSATSMILCIDVTKPDSTLLEKELGISFAEMTRPVTYHSPVHWRTRLWSRLRNQPVPHPRARTRQCLNADRFLLLLTQVDKLCHQLPPSIERTIRFAEMIDPVEQARDMLGVPILKTIRSVLKPEARFAIGVISAMGFHPVTGDPFADVDGTPLNLASESGEDILRRWTPYGIRDAIYFLATGECRGTVKELTRAHIISGPEPLGFSYSVNGHGTSGGPRDERRGGGGPGSGAGPDSSYNAAQLFAAALIFSIAFFIWGRDFYTTSDAATWTAITAVIVSAVGTVSTTLLAWRKDRREARETELKVAQLEQELAAAKERSLPARPARGRR